VRSVRGLRPPHPLLLATSNVTFKIKIKIDFNG